MGDAGQVYSVVRGIIREVTKRCSDHGASVDDNLVGFMVKMILLNPKETPTQDGQLSKGEIEDITQKCTAHLLDTESIVLDTIKMQTQFLARYHTRRENRDLYLKSVENEVESLDQTIAEARPRTREELEEMYRNIVSSVVIRGCLGPATDMGGVREATAALESVLPAVELGSFVSLNPSEKRLQLKELADIVSGIRLFNQKLGKGGSGIVDVYSELSNTGSQLLEKMDEIHDECSELCRTLSGLVVQDPSNQEANDVLTNLCQLLAYLETIQQDVCMAADQSQDAWLSLEKRFGLLQETIESKTAVPTDQVYPQFVELAANQTEFRVERALVQEHAALVDAILPLAEKSKARLTKMVGDDAPGIPKTVSETRLTIRDAVHKVTTHALKLFREKQSLSTQVERVNIETQPSNDQITKEIAGSLELLLPGVTHGYDSLEIQCGGFCPVTMGYDHFLLPVDRSIGMMRYKDRVYGFADCSAAEKFANDPMRCLTSITDRAAEHAELIELLHLQEVFYPADTILESQKIAVKCDGGTQTELHPIEENIDKSYEWNEWELRRKALKLANLRTKATHSSQTESSNYRRENATQVYLPKENGSQTKRDATTNVPKPVTYIRGLRGAPKDSKPAVVNLTLDIGGVSLAPKPKTKSKKK